MQIVIVIDIFFKAEVLGNVPGKEEAKDITFRYNILEPQPRSSYHAYLSSALI